MPEIRYDGGPLGLTDGDTLDNLPESIDQGPAGSGFPAGRYRRVGRTDDGEAELYRWEPEESAED